MIKVKYIGENDSEIDLIKGKAYECARISKGVIKWLIVFDESGEDYCYPAECFEVIDEDLKTEEDKEFATQVKQLIIEETKQHQQYIKSKMKK